jgi:hypothetical protein
LSELGRLFSPFSSILFTESHSYRLPVFKDDGSLWEFDELVHFTASKFVNGGSSAKTPLTIISLSQTPSGSLPDGITGSSQSSSESSSQEGEKPEKKGKERDMGDKDEADKDDEDSYDNPEDPPGDQDSDAKPRGISFKITSEIIQDSQTTSDSETQDKQNIFQTITMSGGLTIEVFLYNYRIVVLPINSTCRRRHWFRIHLGIQNALFNSQGFHFAASRQQTTHTSNFISGLMSIRSRGMPTLRTLNRLQVQI